MKRATLRWSAACLTLCAIAVGVRALPIDDLMRKKVAVKVQEASMDDYLVELARAADVNFIADATDFPKTAEPVSLEQQRPLGNLIIDFARQRKLGSRRFDANTFLFWSAPDTDAALELAHAILPTQTNPDGKPLIRRQMRAWLTDYFKQVHGWNGYSQDVDIKVKLADLPPELRAWVVSETRDEILPWEKIFYSDVFWNTARLRIRDSSNGTGDEEVPHLFVEGDNPVKEVGLHVRSATDVGRLSALVGIEK